MQYSSIQLKKYGLNQQSVDQNELLELFDLSKKGVRTAQNILIKKCKEFCRPIKLIYKDFAKKFGVNESELDSCVIDAFYAILNSNKTFTNFQSYFRKRYEFIILSLIRENKKYYSRFTLFSDEEDENLKAYRSTNYYELPSRSELIEYIDSHREIFTYYESGLLRFLQLGYSLNEISKIFNISYTKCKKIFNSLVKKLEKYLADELNCDSL